MKNKQSITELIRQRVLVLDGAMGTMIQQYNLEEKDFRGEILADHPHELQGNNDILSLTRPDIIEKIHLDYLEAGADLIETNTFNATSISQADYHTEAYVYDINREAARIARRAAEEYTRRTPDRPRYVVGSMGPTNKTASMSPDVNDPGYRAVTFEELRDAYREQAEGLLEGGAEVFMVETIFDTLNAKAALMALEEMMEHHGVNLPVMVSGTITDASGRTLSGQTLEAFLHSISHLELLSVGLNCSLGAKEMRPYIKELSEKSPFYVSTHPNAGLPNQFGEYDETPETMSGYLKDFLDNTYVNIIGGCCGTTPDHIREFARLARQANRHQPAEPRHGLVLSGLEPLAAFEGSNFVNIGERLNVAGSRKFARLIREQRYEDALEIARNQVENGAQVLDVNMDDAMLDAEKEMVTFLRLMMSEPDVARVPVMIDSSKWSVIEAGLQCVQGKTIVNSISLKEGEENFLEQARRIRNYGAAAVVMAFDEEGQAATYERRIAVCERAYRLLTGQVHFPARDIIFDPNVLTIGTGMEEHNNYAVDFIETVRWIRNNLPHAHVSGGISNLSFSFRGNNTVREAIHSVFLYHAIQAGMDMGIVNPGMLQVYDDIPGELLEKVEDLVLNRRPDATERLLAFAETIDATTTVETAQEAWRENPVEERLRHALIKGITEHIESDTLEAHGKYKTGLKVIEGPLMDGMNTVGDLFGAGKVFLPQVVKRARAMKKAGGVMLPYIEQEKEDDPGGSHSAGKVLLATVKGDVHDIGKNIVSVVLGCNNYEIIDLGVMVPTERILEEANDHQVDIIGLSGLITPSLEEMVRVAAEMEHRKMKQPLLIGGATTSRIHTAVKIEPRYSAPVIHVKDASRSVPVVSGLLAPHQREEIAKKVREEYRDLRESYSGAGRKTEFLSLEKARENAFQPSDRFSEIRTPAETGIQVLEDYPLEAIREYINWMFFFVTWEMRGKFPDILHDGKYGDEARRLYDDAQEMLDRIIREKWLKANAVFGIFPANRDGDDMVIYTDASRSGELTRFYNLRNQEKKEEGKPNYCLSDFLAPAGNGPVDYAGAFAVTAGIGIEEKIREFESNHDDYSSIMIKALADRLAEAFTELLHEKIRKVHWGYATDEALPVEDLFREKYEGIRPAHGYPACPDHSEKETLFRLLECEKYGISLTENYAMVPAASVSGLIFAHPESRYFFVGKVGKEQVETYAKRKGISIDKAEQLLASNLNYSTG